jgi:predicted DNA-binding protein
MTKKVTFTLEDNLIEELNITALDLGKKKTQIIREALQEYFDLQSITKTVQEYKTGTLKTISHEDLKKSFEI